MTDAIEPGWHWVGEENKPQDFRVNVVHVRVRVGQEMEVPDEVIRSPNTRWQAFDERKQESLWSLLDALSATANDAYAYWLRVMRWKSGIGFIGEPHLISQSLALNPELECCATDRYFWTARQGVTFPREETVSSQQWDETQSALSSGIQSPIWLDFLFDGEHRSSNRDFVGATLSLAIAFELAIRSLIASHLPKDAVEPLVFHLIDNSNVRAIMNRIGSLSFWDDEWKAAFDTDNLQRLVQTRNDIMHSAKIAGLDEPTLGKQSASVRKFVYQVSRFLKVV